MQGIHNELPGNSIIAWYLDWNWNGGQVGGAHAMTYYVLYSYMIPISLFVTIEISRVIQALYMYWDEGMTSKGGIPMIPRNSNLNEDLGRVKLLFPFPPSSSSARPSSPSLSLPIDFSRLL